MPTVRTYSLNLHLEGRVVLLVGGVVAAECVRRLVVEVLDRVVVSYRVGDLAAGGPSLCTTSLRAKPMPLVGTPVTISENA